MDITTVSCGERTRDSLAEYRDNRGFQNYDAALRDLLEKVEQDQ